MTLTKGTFMKRVICSIVLCVLSISAFASTIYTYVGPNYSSASGDFTTDMNITGSFEVASPLTMQDSGDIGTLITSYSFTNGIHISGANTRPVGIFSITNVEINAAGNIFEWDISLEGYDFTPNPGNFVGIRTRKNDQAAEEETTAYQCNIGNPFPTNCIALFAAVTTEGQGGGTGTWTITTVPIPAALWLFASALGLLGWGRRKALN